LRNFLLWEEIIVFWDGHELRSRAEAGSLARGCQGKGVLGRISAVFAIAVGWHGQAEGTCPEMGHAAEKIHGLFRVSFL